MFTGIVEALGRIVHMETMDRSLRVHVESSLSPHLHVGQSVMHEGVCLTVVHVEGNRHSVDVVEETLACSNLGQKKVGDLLNLERSLGLQQRLDGHWVQGHIDGLIQCTDLRIEESSRWYEFTLSKRKQAALVVPKGSVCINGVSLTVAACKRLRFAVAIIPHTYQRTTFRTMKAGDWVNVEFDIVGKYIARLLSIRKKI